MMIGVYMILNTINNKVYIGSSNNIKSRFSHHRASLNKNEHHSIHLQRAWNKYGADAFIFQVIEECEESVLLKREQYYMDYYKSYDFKYGYNISKIAGRVVYVCKEDNPRYGKPLSEETKAKLRAAHLGKPASEERKQKLRDWYKTHDNPMKGKSGELAPCYGRTGEKHPLYGKTGELCASSKKVICLNTGEIFVSATEAARIKGVNHSKLCMCCRGERKSCGKDKETGEKLRWAYYKEGDEYNDELRAS